MAGVRGRAMQSLVNVLGPLGILVIVASQVAAAMGRTLPGKPGIYPTVGGALILLHVVFAWEKIARAVGKRQLKYGGNAFVLALAVLAILVGANYFVSRHTKRFDLTKNQRYGLSDQTRKVVAGLKDDVKLLYFINPREPGQGSTKAAKDRLREYEVASPRIKTEYIDPLKEPARAREYDLKSVPTLVLERGTKREKVSSGNVAEQEVTNALIKLTRETKNKVCFLKGEGEHDIDGVGDDSFGALKASLEKNQYETEALGLLRENQVPVGCSILVVGGPQRDPQPEVIEGIRRYVQEGGKAIVMLEPDLKEPMPRLEALLKEWNIDVTKDVVFEVYGRLTAAGIEMRPDERILVQQYPYHEITKDFPFALQLRSARSVAAGSGTIKAVTAESLLQTSSASWAETDLKSLGKPELDEKADKRGPISIAATAKIEVAAATPSPSPSPGETPPADEKKKEGRVAVFGDSDFATNASIAYEGNQDFVLNAVAWLSQDTDLISIRPKDADDQRLFLTGTQEKIVYGTALGLLPGLCILAGLFVWWKRR